MDFTSIAFLEYLLVTALVYRLAPTRVRPLVLVISSYAFYYLNSSSMLLLLSGDTVLIYYAARILHRIVSDRWRTTILVMAATFLIGTLVIFKGAFIFKGSWERHLLMPLGVSYYTFKLVGYLVDVYWRVIEPEKSLIDFAAYVAFFPQIVAGPIQRAEQFLLQLRPPVVTNSRQVLLGSQRILLGFFKKLVVADNLATVVNYIYQHLHSGAEPILLGFYIYPLQLYADFSALTDISIGAALLFGLFAPENFDAPFSAVNPSDYWRRWHITLTLWLTDYVFTPLRMWTRNFGNAGLVASLTINMVLIGLWHGFRWTFVIFGLLHALYLSIDALTVKRRRLYYKEHPKAQVWADNIGRVATFHLVAIGLVCFRAQTSSDITFVLSHLLAGLEVWSSAFAVSISQNVRALYVGGVGYVLAEMGDFLRRRNAREPILNSLPRWGRWSVYTCSVMAVCILVMLLFVGNVKRSPFLYAIF